MDFSPQAMRDLYAIQSKTFASWKLNNVEFFKAEKQFKQLFKMQTKMIW